MKAVKEISGIAMAWGRKNVDTDIIIPAKWLKVIDRKGLLNGAFETVRAKEDNIFDKARHKNAPILIAGDNFGCGSSREHAAWVILEMGIQAVIAPSFSDIFSGNAFKNGLLAIEMDQERLDELMAIAAHQNVSINLQDKTVRAGNSFSYIFSMDEYRRQSLLNGHDEIDVILQDLRAIERYEAEDMKERSWLCPDR